MPIVFLLVFAVSRWPGLMPENFSAAYALMFCAGVFFSSRWAWMGALGVLLLSDLALNLHYQRNLGYSVFTPGGLLYMGFNYIGFITLILLGRRFRPGAKWVSLLGGSLLGAVLFYLITNTASWLFNPFSNPEYTRNLPGWLRALTLGAGGFPETWTFFRNTLLSSGLFTLLFTAAHRLTVQESPREQEAPENGPEESDPEAQPEEA